MSIIKSLVVDPALDLLLQESFSLFDTQSGCILDKVMWHLAENFLGKST